MFIGRQSIMAIKDRIQEDPEWKKNNDALNAKRKAAIDQMGSLWLLHPSNHITKKESAK